MGFQNFRQALWGIAACVLISGSPVLADSPADAVSLAELDRLSRTSAEEAPGIALARKEISAGNLLGALAALERVLINHPEADEALLLHASLLCRLDDKAGSVIEFDHLRGRNIPDQSWSEATAPCAADSGSARSGG